MPTAARRRPRRPVTIPKSSTVSCHWLVKDRLVGSVQPFVLDVSDRLARRERLADAVRAASLAHPDAAGCFDFDPADPETSFGLQARYLYREEDAIDTMVFDARRENVRLRLKVPEDSLPDIADLLARSASASRSARELRGHLPDELRPLLDSLLESGFLAEEDPNEPRFRWDGGAPGIIRLQHASLLYRTDKASILVDPHLHSDYEGTSELAANVGFADLRGQVDAIVISHSHADHWYLPTLMLFPRDIPIIVPKVPRSTLLCDDFAQVLRGLGFRRTIALEWYAPPVTVGDLEVHAFPFYGEQPLLAEYPRDRSLRNWGNTYVIRGDRFSSWFLIDSGNDAAGNMAAVAHEVRSRFDRIDFLLSNLRPFSLVSPLYITGAGHYWLALTADQMQRFHSMNADCITLSPAGVAEVCRIARARYFLPYAHWWAELGEPPAEEERVLLVQLAEQVARIGGDTRILEWKIGDQVRVGDARSVDLAGPVRS
jgi:L-ascorbate metabolism protein UlaG (beta-lactamase superfamily)